MHETQVSLIAQQMQAVVAELADIAHLRGEDSLLVIGCSTSGIIGKPIGKAGSADMAALLYQGIAAVQRQLNFSLAFQCCEHLNRALVVERATQQRWSLNEVTVVPVPEAGGAMASYAYRQFHNPVVVETIQADAAIDIGDTLIGMHVRPVAVPVHPTIRTLGEAHVNAARSRPKLIGGARAMYRLEE